MSNSQPVRGVVDRVEQDATGRRFAVLLVGPDEGEVTVAAARLGALAHDGARVLVTLDAGGHVVSVQDDPEGRAGAVRRRAERRDRRERIAQQRPSRRKRR